MMRNIMFHRNKGGNLRVGGKLPSSVLLHCVFVFFPAGAHLAQHTLS